MKDFKQLSETAKENCGSRVELTWSMPRSTKTFRISVKRDQSNDEAAPPLWILREIDGPEAREIWRAETSDINVVRDACYKHSGPPTAAKPGSAGKAASGAKSGQPKPSAVPKTSAAAANDKTKEKVETAKSPVKTADKAAETSKKASAESADPGKAKGKEGERAADPLKRQQTKENEAAKDIQKSVVNDDETAKDFQKTVVNDDEIAKDTQKVLVKNDEAAKDTQKVPVKDDDAAKDSQKAPVKDGETSKGEPKTSTTIRDPEPDQSQVHAPANVIPSSSLEPEKNARIDEIIEEDPAPTAVTVKSKSGQKKSEAVAALTQELSDLMELEVELDINEVDVPPAVANETAPKIEIPKSELAAVDRMRKIIEARQSVSAVREMKADLKLPLISKNPQEEPAKPAAPRATHEEFDIPHIAAALPPVHPQDQVVDDEFADDPNLIDEDASLYEAFGEDGEGARVLDSQLINPKSAFYAATAFFKFLEHEFYRFETDRTPLSLIIFEMQHLHEISSQAATAAALRIGFVKRKLDVIGHFGPDEYAILLPNSNGTTAALIASRVHDALTASPLAEHFDNSSIRYLFGIANLPNNGDDIPSLINAARSAKEHAKKSNGAIVLARSLA